MPTVRLNRQKLTEQENIPFSLKWFFHCPNRLFLHWVTWNDYTQTLYYTKSADIQTLSYYMLSITKASASAASLGETMSAGASSVLTTMSNSAANYKTIELACMVLSALPLIIVYPFAQKFFEKGVMEA
mgnify:CR=1 FL=1